MKNPIEAINVLIGGINTAFTRGAFDMKEVHDLYEAISFLNEAANAQQQSQQAIKPNIEPQKGE